MAINGQKDEEARQACAKTWVLQTIAELAAELELKITAEWGVDKYTKYREMQLDHLLHVVLVTWEGGSEDSLCFEKRELDDYPGNSKKLREWIRGYLEALDEVVRNTSRS